LSPISSAGIGCRPSRYGRDLIQNAVRVIDGPLQRRHIVLPNAAAHNAGVHCDQPLTAARALCPRLSTALRDPGAERQALESIAAWAYRFSAEVSIADPDAIFVEIGASLSLFGGIAALERRSAQRSGRVRIRCLARDRADGHGRARARNARGRHPDSFAPSTVERARQRSTSRERARRKSIDALHGMGFRLLRDLFRLPRPELARRIGPDALDRLDRMRGTVAESLLRYRPPIGSNAVSNFRSASNRTARSRFRCNA
jgi:protein ImuB